MQVRRPTNNELNEFRRFCNLRAREMREVDNDVKRLGEEIYHTINEPYSD